MAKAKKPTAKSVFKAFKGLSTEQQTAFCRLIDDDADNVIVNAMRDALLALNEAQQRAAKAESRNKRAMDVTIEAVRQAMKFDRSGKTQHSERDAVVLSLLAKRDLTEGQIRRDPHVVRLNGMEHLSLDQLKGIKKRNRGKFARAKNNGGAST